MPAEPSNSETPPPTTPNRWRRRTARLWWWMLPGMIATIVLLLASIASNRNPLPQERWDTRSPLSVLTAIGWSPVGRLDPSEFQDGELWVGYTVNYSFTETDFIRERISEERARQAKIREEDPESPECVIEWRTTISGYGFPAPWLMRCDTSINSIPAHISIRLRDGPGFRSVLGFFPVLLKGDERIGAVRGVPFFVYEYLTYYPDPLGFLLNTLIFSMLWMPITAWHRRRRAKRPGCKHCGYSREGLSREAVCPECGHTPAPDSRKSSADSSTSAAHRLITPNRWRRFTSRLWWWLLPGMIATIVVMLATIGSYRRAPLGPGTPINVPTGVLTALRWTPAGQLPPKYSHKSWYCSGLTVHDIEPTHNFAESLRATVTRERSFVSEEEVVVGASIEGFGLPVPWLMRCRAKGATWRFDEYTSDPATPEHRYIFGLIPVAKAGDLPLQQARRVSPFVFDYLTYYPDPLGFLLNTALFSTLWMPITAWHRRRKAKYTNCTRCSYSREGLAQDSICPECGQKPVH